MDQCQPCPPKRACASCKIVGGGQPDEVTPSMFNMNFESCGSAVVWCCFFEGEICENEGTHRDGKYRRISKGCGPNSALLDKYYRQ